MQNIKAQKYPRTFHFDFSPEVHNDDKVQHDIENLINKEIVVLYKLDGGNTTIKAGGPFARSHAQKTSCETFNYIKSIHQAPKQHMLNGLNFHGENMFAKHSISYSSLEDYFYLFGISNSENFLPWDEVVSEAERLSFKVVPELFRGQVSSLKELQLIIELGMEGFCPLGGDAIEGFVVRTVDAFAIEDFSTHVVKYVRKGHVQTDEHWSKNWTKNSLMDKKIEVPNVF